MTDELSTTAASERDVTTPVRYDVDDRVATITLNRPEARNALSTEVIRLLVAFLIQAEASSEVDVIVLTGADPAFCAGVDLRELSAPGGAATVAPTAHRGPFPHLSKPLIGAINGVAITGGLELALNCDFLVASERAKFGDTHARVGVMPGWGLTVLLPQAVGIRRAREMSYTGNFVGADEALRLGLVNHVVAHDDLMPYTYGLARDIVDNNAAGVRQIRTTYDAIATNDDDWETEARDARAWIRHQFSPANIDEQRRALQARGQQQQ